jgi:hypothetical protein
MGAAVAAGMLGLVFGFGGLAFAGQGDHTTKKDNGGTVATSDAAPGGADRSVESGGSGTEGKSMSNPDGAGVDKPYAADGHAADTQGDTVDSDGNNGCGNDMDFADDNNGNCGGLHPDHERAAAAHEADRPEAERGTEAEAEHERCPEASTMGQQQGHGEGVSAHCGVAASSAVAAEQLSAPAQAKGAAGLAADTVTAGATAPRAVPGAALAASVPAAVLGTELERAAEVMGVSIERGPAAGATAPGAQVLGTSVTRGALARTGSSALLLALVALALIAIGVTAKRFADRRG